MRSQSGTSSHSSQGNCGAARVSDFSHRSPLPAGSRKIYRSCLTRTKKFTMSQIRGTHVTATHSLLSATHSLPSFEAETLSAPCSELGRLPYCAGNEQRAERATPYDATQTHTAEMRNTPAQRKDRVKRNETWNSQIARQRQNSENKEHLLLVCERQARSCHGNRGRSGS